MTSRVNKRQCPRPRFKRSIPARSTQVRFFRPFTLPVTHISLPLLPPLFYLEVPLSFAFPPALHLQFCNPQWFAVLYARADRTIFSVSLTAVSQSADCRSPTRQQKYPRTRLPSSTSRRGSCPSMTRKVDCGKIHRLVASRLTGASSPCPLRSSFCSIQAVRCTLYFILFP